MIKITYDKISIKRKGHMIKIRYDKIRNKRTGHKMKTRVMMSV